MLGVVRVPDEFAASNAIPLPMVWNKVYNPFCGDGLGMTVHSVIYKTIILNIANYSKFKRLAAIKNFRLF